VIAQAHEGAERPVSPQEAEGGEVILVEIVPGHTTSRGARAYASPRPDLIPMSAIYPYEDENRLKEEFFGYSGSGYFVEVGANDPERWSQSFHLEQMGWSGILVEPQPELADALRQRRTAKVYSVACSSPENAGKRITLHLAGGHSSFDPMLKVATSVPQGTIDVPVRTLDEILTEASAPSPIDFLAVDVEGHEIEVLRGFDVARWRPRLILVEDHALDTRLHRFMRSRGYRWFRRTDVNGWYIPANSPLRVGWLGRWQFFRKHYLGTPFRRIREALRRVRARRKREVVP
jgi:FkbM family methyltransferase